MSTRWWAPDGPHIGPDERDFELLIPVDDARHDLGAALLALHRVGAAACEEVALHAIPDEVSLVSSLASARTAFAAPLVESVSKSVGEGPYAGLLVRDVIDDAENAALSVFRTLVSKGIPPTLAVQRVGMVYGVPQSDLGNYLSVAGELRVHPAALTDAADRALFSAIEKIAADEQEAKPEPWEPVSKTRPEDEVITRDKKVITREKEVITRDDPATPYYDARDWRGRFARGSVTGPPEVGAPVARKERVGRVERVNRVERVERAQPQAASAERTLQAKPKERVLGRDVARLKSSREEMSETEKNRLISLDPVTWSDGDYLDPIQHPSTQGPFQQIDQELAIGMSTEEWAQLQAHLGRDEQGRLAFRMGHISQERDANIFGRASDYDTDEHRKVLMQLATNALVKIEEDEALQGRQVYLPIHTTVDDDNIVNLDPEQVKDYIDSRKYDAVKDWLVEQGADPFTPENQQYILDAMRMMKSTRSPDNKGDVYHYIPRVDGSGVAPRISVVELVFEPGVMGRDDGHGKHTEYVFDPNQVMRVENGRPAVIYDPKIQAFRLRYFITPDVSKADYLDEHNVTQGAGGRFVREGTRKEVIQRDKEVIRRAEPVERSTPRVERVARTGRVERTIPAFTRKPAERRLSQKERSLRYQQKLNKLEHTKKTQDRPTSHRELFAHGDYRVLDRRTMDSIEKNAHWQPGEDALQVFDPNHKELLLENGMGGQLADYTMKEMTDRAILLTDDVYSIAGAYKELPGPDKALDPVSDDFPYQVHDYMDRLFRRYPDVEQIQVFYDTDGTVKFLANKYVPDPVVLVEVDKDFDPDRPFELEFDSSIRHDELIPDFDEPVESMRQMMSSLHYDSDDAQSDRTLPLKITRPKIDLYQLRNVEPKTDPGE